MGKVICYSIGCPQCRVLEQKLRQKGIEFELISDKDIMLQKGFENAPKLQVDEKIMSFKEAVKWIGEQ